jgi:hypothetical protein
MPVLPVDYPGPFAAVLGTMLYPNEGESAQRRACKDDSGGPQSVAICDLALIR